MRVRGVAAILVGVLLVVLNLAGVGGDGLRWVLGAAGVLAIAAGSVWVRGERI